MSLQRSKTREILLSLSHDPTDLVPFVMLKNTLIYVRCKSTLFPDFHKQFLDNQFSSNSITTPICPKSKSNTEIAFRRHYHNSLQKNLAILVPMESTDGDWRNWKSIYFTNNDVPDVYFIQSTTKQTNLKCFIPDWCIKSFTVAQKNLLMKISKFFREFYIVCTLNKKFLYCVSQRNVEELLSESLKHDSLISDEINHVMNFVQGYPNHDILIVTGHIFRRFEMMQTFLNESKPVQFLNQLSVVCDIIRSFRSRSFKYFYFGTLSLLMSLSNRQMEKIRKYFMEPYFSMQPDSKFQYQHPFQDLHSLVETIAHETHNLTQGQRLILLTSCQILSTTPEFAKLFQHFTPLVDVIIRERCEKNIATIVYRLHDLNILPMSHIVQMMKLNSIVQNVISLCYLLCKTPRKYFSSSRTCPGFLLPCYYFVHSQDSVEAPTELLPFILEHLHQDELDIYNIAVCTKSHPTLSSFHLEIELLIDYALLCSYYYSQDLVPPKAHPRLFNDYHIASLFNRKTNFDLLFVNL